MKFIIKESKLEKIIFKYLDSKDFSKSKGPSTESIYFVDKNDDDYAELRLDFDGWLWISVDLIDTISNMFSIEMDDSKEIIRDWVQSKLTDININATSPVTKYHYRLDLTLSPR